MQKVFRYPVPIKGDGTFKIKMPISAKVLCFNQQDGDMSIWAKVKPDMPTEKRKFRICGSGNELEDGERFKYIGTCFMNYNQLVFHLFEMVD